MNAARVLSMLAIAVVTAAVCVGLGSDAQQRSDVARPMPVGAPIACIGDLNDDGVVNVSDLLALLGAWGPNPGHAADLNGDGVVNVSDLLMLLGAWGDCPGIPPGTVYTELNYIDPPGNGCTEGLCTNGIGGVVTQRSPNSAGYSSPATAWTQTQTGTLETLRVIVMGYESFPHKTGPFTTFADFEQFNYELAIWNGFSSYAANPVNGDIIISSIWPPADHVQRGTNLWGHPTFEWTFDLSSHEIEFQEGQEYILMLRAVGHFYTGQVVRAGSSWPGGPDVMATNAVAANYMDKSPWNFNNPRMGTEIRVRTPSGE